METYSKILIDYILFLLRAHGILALVIITITVIQRIMKHYDKLKYDKYIFALLILLLLWEAVPASIDVLGENYVLTENVMYSRSEREANRYNYTSFGSVHIEEEDNGFFLSLPKSNEDLFPYGEFPANVVYGKYSKIIVSVEPIE